MDCDGDEGNIGVTYLWRHMTCKYILMAGPRCVRHSHSSVFTGRGCMVLSMPRLVAWKRCKEHIYLVS